MAAELKIDLKVFGDKKFEKVFEKAEATKKAFDELGDKLKDNRLKLDALSDISYLRFFDAFEDKLVSIARKKRQLSDLGGPVGALGVKFREVNMLLTSIAGPGLFKKLVAIKGVFLAWAGPIAAIAAGFYLLSRLWAENIGGIQTKWIKFIGTLKNTWAKFDVEVRKILRSLGPFFSTMFTRAFALLHGLFEGLLMTIQILVRVLGPLFKVLSSIFGLTNKEGKSNLELWTKIGKAIAIIAATLGAIALVSNPFGWIVLASTALAYLYNKFEFVRDILGILGKMASIVWKSQFMIPLRIIGIALKLIIAGFSKLWDWIKKIFFNDDINNSALMKALRFVGGIFGKVNDALDVVDSKLAEAENAALNTSPGAGGTNVADNRQANVTINTNDMNATVANAVATQFVNPVVQVNKYG